jgi:single-strand DNA-binding protein
MSKGLNNVNLIGNITSDIELKHTPKGMAYVKFTIACNYAKKVGDKYESAADFIPCVAWGNLAIIIEKYLQKGSLVYVSGMIKISSYEKNGDKKYITYVLVKSINFLGGTRKDAEITEEENISSEEEWNEELAGEEM